MVCGRKIDQSNDAKDQPAVDDGHADVRSKKSRQSQIETGNNAHPKCDEVELYSPSKNFFTIRDESVEHVARRQARYDPRQGKY